MCYPGLNRRNSRSKEMKSGIRFTGLGLIRFTHACAMSIMVAFGAHSLSAAEDKAAIDPPADELLKRMGDYLANAPFFSVDVEVWQDVQLSSGQRVQGDRTIKLQVHRPNQFHAEVHSTRRNRELIYDGSAL